MLDGNNLKHGKWHDLNPGLTLASI